MKIKKKKKLTTEKKKKPTLFFISNHKNNSRREDRAVQISLRNLTAAPGTNVLAHKFIPVPPHLGTIPVREKVKQKWTGGRVDLCIAAVTFVAVLEELGS